MTENVLEKAKHLGVGRRIQAVPVVEAAGLPVRVRQPPDEHALARISGALQIYQYCARNYASCSLRPQQNVLQNDLAKTQTCSSDDSASTSRCTARSTSTIAILPGRAQILDLGPKP